ncbi:ATP-binding protein [Vibrio profundum]|uniref:ATP-binding protein n=1 Tax=Vibrio profundum TaxID=2910247 RepID=UPI003D0CE040
MLNNFNFPKQLSLKNRLLLAAIIWLSAMILAAGVGIPLLVKEYLVGDVKSQLQLSMDQITANIEVGSKDHLSVATQLSDPRYRQPYSGLYWAIKTKNQMLRSRSLWDKNIDVEEKAFRKVVKGAKGERLIYITQTIYLPDYPYPIAITIGSDEHPIEKTLQRLTGQLWLILGSLYVGILFLIRLQVGWSLWPLNKMKQELASLRRGEKDTLNGYYPVEVAPLVTDLNALLFHYQELLERARNHAGNLSHALKTPLSVLKNEIAHFSEPQQHTLRPPIEQIQDQIDYHLGRARMAGSRNILSVKASVSERVDAISNAFDKVYASREMALINELEPELEVAVEPTDLDEMVGNLLENAYKWGNSIIRVHSQKTGSDLIEIFIEDDGPGIPPEKMEQVIKRGVRLDEQTPGTGLGLNIVHEMAHSYRGQLKLAPSKLGGLKATLTLNIAKPV